MYIDLRELKDEQKTDVHIYDIVTQALKNTLENRVSTFDFSHMFMEAAEQAKDDEIITDARFENHIIYSYRALYCDIFDEKRYWMSLFLMNF